MNVTCIICSDVVLPHSEIYATQCGHLFHHYCLIQWIERSKTCPQCRNKATMKTIFRIYLNLANTEGITDDVVSLQSKIDNLEFQLKLKEKEVNMSTDKFRKYKAQNLGLREEVATLENKSRVHDSVVCAFKDQIAYFKSKAKERDRLDEEVAKLKTKLKQMEFLDIAITGSREVFTDMLRQENDSESLVILAATLKKALLDAEKKKLNIEHKYLQLQSELSKTKRKIASLEITNKDLRKEVEAHAFVMNPEQKQFTNAEAKNEESPRVSMQECPTPFSKKALVVAMESSNDSPSVEDKVTNILQSDSPYLCTKVNVMGMTLENNRKHIEMPNNTKKMMIFKRPALSYSQYKTNKPDDVVYNGLGGQSREDIFPSHKVLHGAIRRHRAHISMTSTKLKKVAALPHKK